MLSDGVEDHEPVDPAWADDFRPTTCRTCGEPWICDGGRAEALRMDEAMRLEIRVWPEHNQSEERKAETLRLAMKAYMDRDRG